MHRAEVLGALLSISIIYILTGVLLAEAVERLMNPAAVNSLIMLITASVGIGFNIVLMIVLGGDHAHGHSHGHDHAHAHGHRAGRGRVGDVRGRDDEEEHGSHADEEGHEHGHGHEHDHGHDHGHREHAHGHGHGQAHAHTDGGETALEHIAVITEPPAQHEIRSVAVRAALVHAMSDLIQSVGVLIAAVLIYTLQDRWLDANGLSYWLRADPVCTLVFTVLVLLSTWHTARDCLLVLMCAVPPGVDARSVHSQLRSIRGVEEVRRCAPCGRLAGAEECHAGLFALPVG
jgi:zinc transporter 2